MDVISRHNITFAGNPDGQPIMFVHGYGCDQNMWRFVVPHFTNDFHVVLMDHVGAGGSDVTAYDADRYRTLSGYADDIGRICRELDLADVVLVGHSVSAMIGALATIDDPDRYSHLVMISPSPRYIDDDEYVGGFTESDITELLDSLDSNYLGWSSAMAPVIMGNADRPELGAELTESFCRTDPVIARRFAEATFLSDNRDDLARVTVPTLVLQCTDDAIAPIAVGEFVRDAIPDSSYVLLEATGHCPNLSAPGETSDAIASFLRERRSALR